MKSINNSQQIMDGIIAFCDMELAKINRIENSKTKSKGYRPTQKKSVLSTFDGSGKSKVIKPNQDRYDPVKAARLRKSSKSLNNKKRRPTIMSHIHF